MELTPEQFRNYNADYNEKYVDEVLEHGSGGFKTVTHRRTATRYALERLVADLEPAPLATGRRVAMAVDLLPRGFDIPKGGKGTVTRIVKNVGYEDVVVIFDDDPEKTERYMLAVDLVALS